jgi:xylulokinase
MLGSTVFVEEDEDEALEMERNCSDKAMSPSSPGIIGSGGLYGFGDRLRSQTGTTIDSLSSGVSPSGPAPSSVLTTPDLGLSNFTIMAGGSSSEIVAGANGGTGAGTPTTSNPLTPVVALATADTEAQLGFAKVAEPDVDAFMTYAAILPEFSRLETMVVKGII